MRVNNKIEEEPERYFEENEKEDTTTQDEWHTATTVLREKPTALQTYLKKHGEA